MKYSLLKRISAFVLAFALVMTTAFNAVGTTQANAAKKATVSAKGATVTVGASKNIKVSIKCKAKAKATIKVAVVKGATGKVTKKVTNSNAKKAAKTCKSTIKVTGKKAGKVKLSITPYINGKKAGKAKKITVTVKAKATTEAATTAATTAASADATTQATTEQPALKEINLTADTTDIDVNGVANLTVTSATDGISVASVSYSVDSAVAEVSATGVVTGKAVGTAVVTATASDAAGNKVTKSIVINVKELAVTVSLASSADATKTLAAGETARFTPVVTPSTWKLVYSSTDTSVATVSGDGTITAIKAGTATIIATALGSSKKATCNVNVVASSYGIAEAKAIHANTVKVTFTTPISKADQANIDVALTQGGAKQSVTPKWAADGSYVELTKASEFVSSTALEFVATLSGTNMSIDAKTSKCTFTIKPATAEKIVIASGQASPATNTIKVKYQVLDQYGDDVKSAVPTQIIWQLNSTNSSLVTGQKEASGTYGVAELITAGTFARLNQEKGYNEILTIGATLANNSLVTTYTSYTIKAIQITGVSLKVVNPNTSGEAQAIYQNDTKAVDYEVTFDAVDEFQNAMDPDIYRYYSNSITFFASNIDSTAGDSSSINFRPQIKDKTGGWKNTSTGAFQVATPANTAGWEYVEPVYTGKAVFTVPAGKYGKFKLNAQALAGSTISSVDVEVKAAAAVSKLVWDAANYGVHIGEYVEIPVTFEDQYGKKIDGPASYSDFNVSFADTLSTADCAVTYDDATKKVKVNLAAAKTNGKTLSKDTTLTITAGNKAEFKTTKTITVKNERTPSAMKLSTEKASAAEVSLSVVEGENRQLKIELLDQDGVAYTQHGYGFVATVSDGSKLAVSPNDAYAAMTNGSVGTYGYNGTQADPTKWTADSATLTVTGKAAGTSVINVQLYKTSKADDTIVKGANFKINVTVGATPSAFTLTKTDATNNSCTAGTKVNFTLQAKNSAGDDIKYGGIHDLTITRSLGTETYEAENVTFNKDTGKATFDIQPKAATAPAGVTLTTKITMGNGQVITVNSASKLVVNAGDPKSIVGQYYAGSNTNNQKIMLLQFKDEFGNDAKSADSITLSNFALYNITNSEENKVKVSNTVTPLITSDTYKAKKGTFTISGEQVTMLYIPVSNAVAANHLFTFDTNNSDLKGRSLSTDTVTISAYTPVPDKETVTCGLTDIVKSSSATDDFDAAVVDQFGDTYNVTDWTYTTSDPAKATVAIDGTVTGIAAGTVTITAVSPSNNITIVKTITISE